MIIITVEVDAPVGQAVGIKEDLAAYLERYGDAKVISIKERGWEQGSLFGRRGYDDGQ